MEKEKKWETIFSSDHIVDHVLIETMSKIYRNSKHFEGIGLFVSIDAIEDIIEQMRKKYGCEEE